MTIDVKPGVVLELNNTEFSLTPESFPGGGQTVSFSLPAPVDIGTPGDLATFISNSFGAGTLPDFSSLPAPLSGIASRIAALDITLEQFDLTVPGNKDAQGNTVTPGPNTYTVGLAGTWHDAPIEIGPLKIKGVFLKIVQDGKTS